MQLQTKTCGGELPSAPARASGRYVVPLLGAEELDSTPCPQHPLAEGPKAQGLQTTGSDASLRVLTKWLHPRAGGCKPPPPEAGRRAHRNGRVNPGDVGESQHVYSRTQFY